MGIFLPNWRPWQPIHRTQTTKPAKPTAQGKSALYRLWLTKNKPSQKTDICPLLRRKHNRFFMRKFASFRDEAAHPTHTNRQTKLTTAQAQKCLVCYMSFIAYILFFRHFSAFFGRAGFGSTFRLLHQI